MQEKNQLGFEVLSDNGNIVARQYTTVFRNADAPVATMNQLGIDFNAHYSDDSQELPVPAVFVIHPNGQVAWAKATGGDYRHRVEASKIINALQKK
jgi:peroxiredoxin